MDQPFPDDPAALLAQADALRDEADWTEAAEAYAAYLRRRPRDWQVWLQYGHCLKAGGDLGAALMLYAEADRLAPGEPDVAVQHGHILTLLGRLEDASAAYARALALDPGCAAARAALLLPGVPPDGALGLLAFDVSDLIDYCRHSRTPTGIQRVQLALVREALAGATGLPAAAVLFRPDRDGWAEVPADLFLRLAALAATGGDVEAAPWQAILAELGTLADAPPLPLGPMVTLVAIGTAWWLPDYLARVRDAKARHGIRYLPVVHDCIPLVVPEHCAAGLVDEFATWFAAACLHADGILAISDNTRADVERLQRRLFPELALPVRVLPLDAGALLPPGLAGEAPGATWPRPFVLFVATIESRKNHLLVFHAWLTLIRRHGAEAVPDLVCVGKRGWLAEPALGLLANSALLRGRVTLLHDIPDTTLDGLYRACRFTLFNSFYEGWGLPVTESLGYGKVPVVADNSSLRQAGGAGAVFFASQSEPALVAAVETLLFTPGALAEAEARVAADARPRAWREVAGQLGALVAELAGELALPPPLGRIWLDQGQVVEMRLLPGPDPRPEMAIAEVLREGPAWGRLKPWGVRTLRGRAVLRLPLRAGGEGPWRVLLDLQGPPGGGRFGLRAGPAGAVGGEWRWVDATDHERLFAALEVPGAAGEDLAVEIMVPEGSPMEDGRRVGPNLLAVMACREADLAARLAFLEQRGLHRRV